MQQAIPICELSSKHCQEQSTGYSNNSIEFLLRFETCWKLHFMQNLNPGLMKKFKWARRWLAMIALQSHKNYKNMINRSPIGNDHLIVSYDS